MVFVPALIFFILILVASAVKICREYERGVVFRLGRLVLPPKGPGIFLIIPVVDRMLKISLADDTSLAVRTAVGMSAGKTIESENSGSTSRQMKQCRAANTACADYDDVVSAH